jgi:4-hydroxybutyrate CoA-transferase
MAGEWRQAYAAALASGANWVGGILPGDHIFIGSASGEPTALVTDLMSGAERGDIPSVSAYQMFGRRRHGILQGHSNRVRVIGLNATPDLVTAMATRAATYLPLTIFQLASAIAKGRLHFDASLVHVSPPDAEGYMSFGVSVDFSADACRQSRLVVAQVNPHMPRTFGAQLHVSEVNAVVEIDAPIPTDHRLAPEREAQRIGEHTAELIPHGATLEFGVGGVMTAVLDALRDHRDIGLHTGLLVDPMAELIERGVVTNAQKGIDVGVTVANQARGTERLYAFLDGNPVIAMRPASYTHDPDVLRTLRHFTAINSAIEVDLLGRVNSEFVDGRRVASSSGLPDFVRAVQANSDGRSIIALRSTAADGSVSRIRTQLGDNPGATLTADLADLVVTEHGIADLREADEAQRAERMIAIADPQFRERLTAEWVGLGR